MLYPAANNPGKDYPMRTALLALFLPLVLRADDDALRKLMPKDQLDAVEKMDAVEKLFADARAEPNGLRKTELGDKARKDQAETLGKLSRELQKHGMKGWAFKVAVVGGSGLTADAGHIHLVIDYDNLSETVKATVRDLRAGDTVVVTLSPSSKLSFPGTGPNASRLRIDGRPVKSLERKD